MTIVAKNHILENPTGVGNFEYTIDRYYYTRERRFEQSIDVYRPVSSTQGNNGHDAKERQSSKIPVILVMGSAWLGHKPYFYAMTNWWNSSAPKQICGKLGHPCVSIRHSGGYFFGSEKNCSSSYSTKSWILCLASLIVSAIAVGVKVNLLSLSLNMKSVIAAVLLIWYQHRMGAAGIDEMVSDVSTALGYIDAHAHELGLSALSKRDTIDGNRIPVVFGGYSSGAHVAATLLTGSILSPIASSLDEDSNQKLKCITIHSVLYISGVLDVPPDSFVMTMLSRVVLRKLPSEVPSPLRTLLLHQHVASHGEDTNHKTSDRQHKLPQLVSLPPHILIGCQREVFGWSVLDSAFCASEYANALRILRSDTRQKGDTSIVTVDADESNENDNAFVRLILLKGWSVNHWSILSSAALRNALQKVLTDKGANRR